ncbi:sensor histidine kinase [Paenibacillus sp. KS-LC4]|uniref:sensor histidine kinase n=1 Tax=Paenibacillus sp. KS-LC4 TaxID=2979727 RepID=UPI0030D0D7F3
MKAFLAKFKYHGLFIKMFTVTLVSIISVSLLTTLVMLQMSQRLFMDTFSITNGKIMNQVQTNFESFSYSIVTATNTVQQSGTLKSFLTDPDERTIPTLRRYYEANTQVKRIQSGVAAYPVTITITGINGRSHSTDGAYWPRSAAKLRSSELTENALKEPRRILYELDRDSLTDKGAPDPVIVATKALLERTSGQLYGQLYFAIREKEFQKFYTSFTSSGNNVVILNRAGMIVSSNSEQLIGTTAPELLAVAKQIEEQQLDVMDTKAMGKSSLVLSKYLPTYDFYLVNLIDKQQVMSQMVDFKRVALISLAIVLLALIIVFVISRRLTKSLTLLARQISRVTKNDFNNYTSVTGSYEIKQLGNAYNYMLDELNDYVKRLIQTQKDQRNAELSALQMQINPHFLYNTLASIKILVQQGNKDKAAETINALISLLQNTVSNISETITVSQELVNLKNYVFINHVRYGEQIRVNYFADKDCMGAHLPKLVIQPFMENAFFHAFHERSEGYIYVLISREGESLICEVVDNGVGISGLSNGEAGAETNEAAQNNDERGVHSASHFFSGIGIRNVHDRLTLLYGEGYGVTIVSDPGQGTRVKIKLPLLFE